MVKAAIFALAVLMSSCAHSQTTKEELVQAFSKATGSAVERKEYVDYVFTHQNQANSTQLFFAARNALELGRVEDSGFLFFAAQLRARLDFFAFPDGASNAKQALGAAREVLGEAINPVIVKDPATYKNIVIRLKGWEVVPTGDYSPGWQSNPAKTKEEMQSEAKSIKQSLISYMSSASSLFEIPEYHSAMMIVQIYNLSTPEKGKDEKLKSEYESALAVIKTIEKSKGFSFSGIN